MVYGIAECAEVMYSCGHKHEAFAQHTNASDQHANASDQHANTSDQHANASDQQHANTSDQHANASDQHANGSLATVGKNADEYHPLIPALFSRSIVTREYNNSPGGKARSFRDPHMAPGTPSASCAAQTERMAGQILCRVALCTAVAVYRATQPCRPARNGSLATADSKPNEADKTLKITEIVLANDSVST